MSCQLHICSRCARKIPTCCETSEVYTTPGDVARIVQFTNDQTCADRKITEQDFTEFGAPQDPVYYQFEDDPIWRVAVFREDGTRRILKRKENGHCYFLNAHGCSLPLEVRPLVCRIYPYDYNEQGIHDELARGCPTELLLPGETLIAALDMNRAAADVWHAQLYREVRQEPHFISSKGEQIASQAQQPLGCPC